MKNLAILSLLLISPVSFACECFLYDPVKEFENADFVGIVVIDDSYIAPKMTNTETIVSATVIRKWKGTQEKLNFRNSGSMCSPYIVAKQRYLLFLRNEKGSLALRACSASLKYKRWFPTKEQTRLMRLLSNK